MLALPFLSSSFRTYTENARCEGHAFAFPTLRRERRMATSLAYLAISRPLNTNSHQWGQEGVWGGYLKKEGYLSLPLTTAFTCTRTNLVGTPPTHWWYYLPKQPLEEQGCPLEWEELTTNSRDPKFHRAAQVMPGALFQQEPFFFSSSVGLCHRLHLNH